MLSKIDTRYLARYRDIAWLLMRHGGRELLRLTGLDSLLKPEDEQALKEDAIELATDLERMGPTFVKLGQMLAGRSDLLPQTHLEALRRLQGRVKPFGFDEVQRIIREELGRDIHEIYASFDPEPLAAASIGQVHTAVLKSGDPVVVKVQRPKAQETIELDLRAMEQIASLLDEHTDIGRKYHFRAVLRQLERSLRSELDYTHEADNLRVIRDNLAGYEKLLVPSAFDELTTPRVLTMQRVIGRTLGSLNETPVQTYDAEALAEQFLNAYLQQIIVDGIFHADPHPGNLMLSENGRLALIDLGLVGHVSTGMQESILQLLVALSEGRTEDAAMACEDLGNRTENYDGSAYRGNVREVITQEYGRSVSRMQLGQLVLRMTRIAADSGLRIAPEVMLLGKTLVLLDESGRLLAPEYDTNEAIRRQVAKLLRRKLAGSVSLGQSMVAALQTKQFLSALPNRISKALDIIADNAFRVKVDALDENRLVSVIEKIANRVTIGLVVSAMILAGALLMGVDSPHMIWGYPAFGLILLVIGLVIGAVVLARVFWNDFVKGS